MVKPAASQQDERVALQILQHGMSQVDQVGAAHPAEDDLCEPGM